MAVQVFVRNSTYQQILILLSIYINAFLHGCIYGWMSIAVYFFNEGREITATLTECAWIASLTEIGKIIAAFPAGILVDTYGRKKMLVAIGCTNLTSWLILSLTASVPLICLARFMLGISLSLKLTTGIPHIGEIASPQNRGKFSSAYQACSSAGIAFPALLGAVSSSYRLAAYGPAIIAILYFIALRWSSESPNYYISTGKYDKAKQVLDKIRSSNSQDEINSEYETLKSYIENEIKIKKQLSWVQFMKSKPIRNSIITGTLLEFFNVLTGLFVISAFMANIIPKNRYISEKYYPSLSLMLSTICNISSTFIIEKLPRRTAYLIGGLIGCLIQVANGWFRYLCDTYPEEHFVWLFLCGYILLRVLWGTLIFPLLQTVKSEIFPQAIKGVANSICIVCASFSTLISYELFHITYEYLGLHYLFGSFALAFLCLMAVVHFGVPEGRGKRIADLQIEIRQKSAST